MRGYQLISGVHRINCRGVPWLSGIIKVACKQGGEFPKDVCSNVNRPEADLGEQLPHPTCRRGLSGPVGVSGVLVDLNLPYIVGYKPRGNYQGILAAEVECHLERNPGLIDRLASAPALNPTQVRPLTTPDLGRIIEDPPERASVPSGTSKPWLSRRGRKIDFAERDAANRRLGRLGEQFVLDLERFRLGVAGRDDLARRVIWASEDIGDGLGFDILSYDAADESERLLEVKTTGLGKFSPFYVTNNEVRCSEDIPHQFQLFRVFEFGREPRLYILHGSLKALCRLEPVLFRAIP